jgi:hypothetical protein
MSTIRSMPTTDAYRRNYDRAVGKIVDVTDVEWRNARDSGQHHAGCRFVCTTHSPDLCGCKGNCSCHWKEAK